MAGALIVSVLLATAGTLTAGAAVKLVQASAASPFASCTSDGGQAGTSYPNTEVEPWIAVNPTNPNNIVGAWQQDRWSDGGARGLVAGVSLNGGAQWQQVVIPKITKCSGADDYERASDPWVSFAPNGHLYHISLSLNTSNTANALLVSKSIDGGATWGDP
jgi:hypothetical protein